MATVAAYEKYNLGKRRDSLQVKVNAVMAAPKIYKEIESDLVQLNVKPKPQKR